MIIVDVVTAARLWRWSGRRLVSRYFVRHLQKRLPKIKRRIINRLYCKFDCDVNGTSWWCDVCDGCKGDMNDASNCWRTRDRNCVHIGAPCLGSSACRPSTLWLVVLFLQVQSLSSRVAHQVQECCRPFPTWWEHDDESMTCSVRQSTWLYITWGVITTRDSLCGPSS